MHTTFIKALKWNSSANFLYKIMLLSHQILLYSVISKTLYGLQSSLFAIMYTIIALTNFGFEETLLPFFSIYSQSKSQFKQILSQFFYQIIMLVIITIIFYLGIAHGSGEFLHNLQLYCNKNLIFILSLLFFVESCKKTLLAIMQLAFLNQQIAYAQIIMLSCYIACVWSLYGFYNQVTALTIFVPMLITSSLELWYCVYNVWNFYNGLSNEPAADNIPLKVLFKQRVYNYLNQITKAIYSPNSMTLFFAHLFGFQQAATIKFFTNIITLLYTCISKSIGVTTGATFSAMNQMSLISIQSFFVDVTKRYFQFLYLLTSIVLCVLGYAWYTSFITTIMTFQILLFFSISFLEHLSITYEQLFMSQRKAWPLALVNVGGLIILIPSLYVFAVYGVRLSFFLGIFVGIKILSLWKISSLAYQYWGITLRRVRTIQNKI
ncbi:hypothetical protein KBC04_03280 [Candidatus Babeliales bacterium]|nr:hypothetical protein [Candidatus Babeliales bacterium]MBP9843926.1 hypothetical protein [Candidatus Babeliales bacterium]